MAELGLSLAHPTRVVDEGDQSEQDNEKGSESAEAGGPGEISVSASPTDTVASTPGDSRGQLH